MSCIEHAIENAIIAIEKNWDFENWKSKDPNLNYVKATPEEIWEMAAYVVFTYKPYHMSD